MSVLNKIFLKSDKQELCSTGMAILVSWLSLAVLIYTVQLGYCDSDVTVCLLFWNMPIIQDRDVKVPYKQYTYYLQAY